MPGLRNSGIDTSAWYLAGYSGTELLVNDPRFIDPTAVFGANLPVAAGLDPIGTIQVVTPGYRIESPLASFPAFGLEAAGLVNTPIFSVLGLLNSFAIQTAIGGGNSAGGIVGYVGGAWLQRITSLPSTVAAFTANVVFELDVGSPLATPTTFTFTAGGVTVSGPLVNNGPIPGIGSGTRDVYIGEVAVTGFALPVVSSLEPYVEIF